MFDSDRPSRPPLILIANEQEWSARSLESILGPNGYAVVRAYTGRQTLDLVRTAQPDAVVLDVRMSDMDGLEVCQALRSDVRVNPAMPIVVTASGPSGRAQRLAAFRAGAWEFCSQPLDAEILLLTLRTFVRAKRETDRVRDDSLVDPITGLYNLRGLARRAREIGAEVSRRRDALACVAFAPDAAPALDSIRNTDEVAARMVDHLSAVCRVNGRVSDAIGRVGQAEFAVIAPSTEAKGAVRLVERLQQSLESTPISIDGVPRTMSLRAGYCAVPDFAESTIDAVELLLRATTALRGVRDERNRSRIRAFDDDASLSAVS